MFKAFKMVISQQDVKATSNFLFISDVLLTNNERFESSKFLRVTFFRGNLIHCAHMFHSKSLNELESIEHQKMNKY